MLGSALLATAGRRGREGQTREATPKCPIPSAPFDGGGARHSASQRPPSFQQTRLGLPEQYPARAAGREGGAGAGVGAKRKKRHMLSRRGTARRGAGGSRLGGRRRQAGGRLGGTRQANCGALVFQISLRSATLSARPRPSVPNNAMSRTPPSAAYRWARARPPAAPATMWCAEPYGPCDFLGRRLALGGQVPVKHAPAVSARP